MIHDVYIVWFPFPGEDDDRVIELYKADQDVCLGEIICQNYSRYVWIVKILYLAYVTFWVVKVLYLFSVRNLQSRKDYLFSVRNLQSRKDSLFSITCLNHQMVDINSSDILCFTAEDSRMTGILTVFYCVSWQFVSEVRLMAFIYVYFMKP